MSRKRYTFEMEEDWWVRLISQTRFGNHMSNFQVEDIPDAPKEKEVTIVREDLRALAALQTIAEFVNEKCDELNLDRDAKCGKPTPEPLRSPDGDQLRPCPFCGGEAMWGGQEKDKDGIANSHGRYRVFCAVCSASDGNPYTYHNSKNLAINGWNRRTP